MPFALGLLAAALLGADGPAHPAPAPSAICYEFKIFDMQGLDWRSSFHAKLQPVARQGNATIWAAPAEVVASLVKQGRRVIMAPKVTAAPRAPAHISQFESRKFVTDMARMADGPVNHASYVAFEPKLADAREGVSATISGRKIDQGVLACVAIDDREIAAMHAVNLPDALDKSCADCEQSVPCAHGVLIQIPETSHCEVTGEWLIPNGGALIVSFGVHTMADVKGKAVVRERVAVIEAACSGDSQAAKAVNSPLDPKTGPNVAGPLLKVVPIKIRHSVRPTVIVPEDCMFCTVPSELAAGVDTAAPGKPANPGPSTSRSSRAWNPVPGSSSSKPVPSPEIPPFVERANSIPMPAPLPPLPVASSLTSAPQPSELATLPPPPRVAASKTKVDLSSVKAKAVDPMVTNILAAFLPKKSSGMAGWIPLGGGKTFELDLPVLGNVEINVQAYARPKPAASKSADSAKPD